jgi:3-oxoacyl-(acyl-carrier-protein) synthase
VTQKVYITGLGIVSAIGCSPEDVLRAIREKRSGIGYTSSIDTIYKDEIPVAEVKRTDNELYKDVFQNSVSGFYSRAALMGLKAAGDALEDAGIECMADVKTGLISSTSVGGMDKTEGFFPEYLKDPGKGRLRNVAGHDCGDSTEVIARFFGIRDFVTTISTACSSAANAIMLGSRLIKAGILDRVVVGGTDSLTKFTINGFNTLMILDRAHCRPFDETRSGLNIGEGAAYLVLESEKLIANGADKKIYGLVSGYGNACDAFHQTASSPEGIGPRLAMEKALACAGLKPEEISYINVHGTGTPNNDLSEGKAMEAVFNQLMPPFSSTKSFTGHTLGAAGSIEAVISILAMNNHILPPNLNFENRINELTISPLTDLVSNFQCKHILSNSFGFGGNNTSIIFSKHNV